MESPQGRADAAAANLENEALTAPAYWDPKTDRQLEAPQVDTTRVAGFTGFVHTSDSQSAARRLPSSPTDLKLYDSGVIVLVLATMACTALALCR